MKMATTDYGAIMKVDGVFVNKDSRSRFADTKGMHIPDHVWDKGAPRDFEDNYFVYAGEGKLYGLWVAVYKYSIDIVYDTQLIRHFDARDLIKQGNDGLYNDKDLVVDYKDKNLLKFYICRLSDSKKAKDRYYMGFDVGTHHYEIIFGLGIDSDTDRWNERKSQKSYSFTPYEIREIDIWFDDSKNVAK